jgi:TolA-binding protein
MLSSRNTVFGCIFFLLLQVGLPSFGQQGFSISVKKPKPYEERVLKSEKTDNTKFNVPRHFFQNTFTHYNYFFNANNRLNAVLEQAKLSHRDNYSQLLTFYGYTADEVAQYKSELDSLVYKSKTAIVLHDLRNDWVDNMYLIWGASYYLRKDYDSAFLMFQFINYAFAPKEKDGYYRFIGSKMDGNNAMNIATKEKNTLLKRALSEPPSRNDAFIWQARTFIAMEKYGEAASLIAALKNDPVFPDRLKNDLEEVQALYYYQQNMWDSSAIHLTEALSNAESKKDRIRWEYLIAQMYEKSNHYADAQTYYTKVIKQTIDPVLEVYARLNSIRVTKDSTDNYIDKNIADLVKMAHRDRFVDYRDIIYYMAAQMELERNNTDNAEKFLLKSVSYPNGNDAQRNKAFLQLAEINFAKKNYLKAHNFYDSLQMGDPDLPEPEKIATRKEVLAKVAFNLLTIDRQDSLQRLSTLPEDDRKAYVKKIARKLRKLQGLKEEDFKGTPQGLSSDFADAKQGTPDLFNSSQKGEWYFYNQALRTKGSGEFKSKWGNRPNADNWRRASAISGAARGPGAINNQSSQPGQPGDQSGHITFDGLYDNIPLTEEKMKVSNDSIQNAMIALTNLYAEDLEDCPSVIETSDTLLKRFPDAKPIEQVLFNLYHCYYKNGETAKAEQVKKELAEKYPDAKYTAIVKTGKNPDLKKEEPEATKIYQDIYDQFIAGNFDEALAKKKNADSIYGTNYWTPQLLYIEAVYLAKQRQDTSAEHVLQQIMSLYSGTPLAQKAETLFTVLQRRTIIENELANLVIERPAEDTTAVVPEPVIVEEKRPVVNKDTTAIAKNQPNQPNITNNAIKKSATDSVAIKVAPPPLAKFDYDPADKHFVAIILNRVDNVFRNEAKNAFSIYNREKYYNKTFDYSIVDIDAENKLLLVGGFNNAQEAIDYLQEAKPVATTRIMPWLKPEKYSFSIISSRNLEILKTNLKLDEYRKFADQNWKGKF